ncbi:MAG: hypothetical protein WCI21_05990 [Alphaproteobacteria bacterium]
MIIKEIEPVVVHTTEVHETFRDNDTAAWWIGGIVAIAAIVAIVFLISRPAATSSDLVNASEQGRLAGQLEASQSVGSGSADAAQSAADRAEASASKAADSASKAASAPTPSTTVINVPAPAAPAVPQGAP